eukprot:CAMPEP_0116121754 /NCGR_PEP_ID=MMETSP0329-20121206/3862_1 /TAXON_ID=697910 /ORGANISM="Pseudo-nitzschia arenysensis, Strain B593" /LENGTH=270 /DNA_ID=CAMNT_0003615581 /DNA_START=38 /DNA_END=850 /DNA_ORIENTATION=+
MSGRLIILGKKGYCPWNSKNLERIQRDEKEHREAQEREQEQEAAKASALRLSILKKNSNEGEKSLQRFSLFESEEKLSSDKSNKAYVSKSTSFDRKGTARNDSERNREERRTSLERNFLTRRDQRSQFYLKPPPTKKEIQRHRDMDPMKQFRESEEFTQETSHQKSIQNVNSDCAVRERKRSSKRGRSSDDDCSSDGDMKFERTKERHRKKKSRHREDSRRHKHRKRSKSKREKPNHSACNSASSIKELREKRKKREEQERQRQAAFLNS